MYLGWAGSARFLVATGVEARRLGIAAAGALAQGLPAAAALRGPACRVALCAQLSLFLQPSRQPEWISFWLHRPRQSLLFINGPLAGGSGSFLLSCFMT